MADPAHTPAHGESEKKPEAEGSRTSGRVICVPEEYKRETLQVLGLAGPVFISQLMGFLIGFISTVFCGHLGTTELAGVALATAVLNVTGISIGSGLAETCDTLISQTYGSGNLKRIGVILQRGILILLLACFPCWAILINTEGILLAAQQSPSVARLSQLYVKISMPSLPAAFMYYLEIKYLQNQGIIWPQVIISVIVNILNAVLNYVFLFILHLGVAGSAVANSVSMFSLAVLLYVFIRYRRLHEATWDGWSRECLLGWGSFLRLGLPSMFMHCLEWWLYEIAAFLAGMISDVELGAQSIVYQLSTFVYMFPCGLAVAASVRVGTSLGSGNVKQAKLAAKISFIWTVSSSCLTAVCIIAAKDVIGYIFSSDIVIVQRVSDVMILYGFTHISEALMAVTCGVIRGAGKQMFGAVSSLVCYYFVGLPIGVAAMFVAKMGYIGIWIGLLIAGVLLFVLAVIYLWRLDWNQAVKEALIRAGVKVEEEKKDLKAPDVERSWGEPLGPRPEEKPTQPAPGQEKPPTLRQLVVRRALVALVMLLVLAAGIATNELVSRFLLSR